MISFHLTTSGGKTHGVFCHRGIFLRGMEQTAGRERKNFFKTMSEMGGGWNVIMMKGTFSPFGEGNFCSGWSAAML